MRVFLTIVCLSLTILACNHSKNLTSANNLKQGIRGTVKEESGNRMPGPGREMGAGKSVQTTVYVYETTNLSQTDQAGSAPLYSAIRSKLIDSVKTDEQGNFAVALKPGNYSVFAGVDGKYFSNSFDGKNNIGPVTVEKKKVVEVNIVININAVY